MERFLLVLALVMVVYAFVAGALVVALEHYRQDLSERLRFVLSAAWPVSAIAALPMFATWSGMELTKRVIRRPSGRVFLVPRPGTTTTTTLQDVIYSHWCEPLVDDCAREHTRLLKRVEGAS